MPRSVAGEPGDVAASAPPSASPGEAAGELLDADRWLRPLDPPRGNGGRKRFKLLDGELDCDSGAALLGPFEPGEIGKPPGMARVEGVAGGGPSGSALALGGMGLERLRGRCGREGLAAVGRMLPRKRVRKVPG